MFVVRNRVLIESMEGKRGEPRNRPPFPVEKAATLDKPTVVNNVETLCCVTPSYTLTELIGSRPWALKESAGTKLPEYFR